MRDTASKRGRSAPSNRTRRRAAIPGLNPSHRFSWKWETLGVAADAKLTQGRRLKIDPPRREVLPSGGPHVGGGGSSGDPGLEAAGQEHPRDQGVICECEAFPSRKFKERSRFCSS